MEGRSKSLLYIHAAVLLFGAAGLFGKTIAMPAILITLGRVVFATFGLGMYFLIIKQSIRLQFISHYLGLAFAGFILAFHWFAFFYAIQLSTVAIGLLTFSTFPVFTALLEPWFYKEKFRWPNIGLAVLTLSGIYLIVPRIDLDNSYFMGAIWGILSGFSFAILQLINRKYITIYSSLTITFYEVFIASVVLLPAAFMVETTLSNTIVLQLVFLGILFTALAHSLFIRGLEKIPVFTASIIATLEPVYGILFAVVIISEHPEFKTITGGLIVIFANMLLHFFRKK